MLSRLVRFVRAYNTRAGRHAARNLVGLAVCTGLSQLAMLGVLVLAANHLGAAGFGSFIFALTVQNVLALIGSAGAQPVVVRDAALHPERMDEIASAFFTVTGASSLLIASAVIAGSFFVPLSPDEREVIILFAVANIAASINLSPLFDAQHQQMRGTAGTTIADLLAISTVALLALAGSLTLLAFGIILAGKWILSTLNQALLYHFTIRRFRLRLSLRDAWRMARSSYPILASYFLCILPLNFGVFFLRFFRGQEATGVFGLACQIGLLTFAFGWLGIRVIMPHIGGEFGLDRGFIRKLVLFLLLYLTGLGLAAFLGGSLVIWIAFDPAFRQAIMPMGVLVAASTVLSAGVVASLYLLRFHGERRVLFVYACSAGIYLGGCALLVPEYGIAGAAGMTLTVSIVATSIMILLASRLLARRAVSPTRERG
jgi:O-antigen/teichoic acid export membrane protein